LTVIFDHVAERAVLTSIDGISTDDHTTDRIKKWLAAPDSNLLVVAINPPGLK